MKNERGFSLVELLIVVVIIGIIAAIAVPAYQKGVVAAENRSVATTLKIMASTQATFFSQKQRFARLDELNAMHGNGFGTMGTDQLFRNKFTIEMSPLVPTDAELRSEYTITASRADGSTVYIYVVTPSGRVERTSPGPESD